MTVYYDVVQWLILFGSVHITNYGSSMDYYNMQREICGIRGPFDTFKLILFQGMIVANVLNIRNK